MRTASKLAYAALLPAFLPAHLLFRAGLRKSFDKARAGERVAEMLGRDESTLGLPTAVKVDPPVELDYLEHRSAAYVARLALDSAKEAARALTGESAADEPTDEELANDLASSNPARLMRRSDADDAWILDLDPVRASPWFNRDRFEVTRFVFETAAGRYEIHDVHGRVHRPGDPTWRGARRKLVAQLSVWCVLDGHAWTHFWLPDVIAATVHESLPRETNVYRLLAPHTRFALRHNHTGLWVQRASNNAPGRGKRAVPWYAVPMRAEDMRRSVMRAAEEYHRGGDHFTYPDRMDRRLPYFDWLAAYWEPTYAFVGRLMPSLERDAFEAWARVVDGWYPGFAKVDMQRAIAIVVWHLGIAHAFDHMAYTRWARRYGTSEIEPSIEALSRSASAYDRYRFLAFIENFAVFRPPPTGIDLRLVTSNREYGFAAGSDAEAAARQFMDELGDTDRRMVAAGRQIVPVDDLIRAICF